MRTMHVSKLAALIRDAIESVGEQEAKGVISEITVSSSHHAYFTLSAEGCRFRCVMHRGHWIRRREDAPAKGDIVTVTGRPSLYAQKGDLQLIVTKIATTPQDATP
jgi:exodeoxyribonuclease VII large subunit